MSKKSNAIRVSNVRIGGNVTTVCFRLAKKHQSIRCSSPAFRHRGAIRVKRVEQDGHVEFRAVLLGQLDQGFIGAKTPSKAFAQAVNTWWA